LPVAGVPNLGAIHQCGYHKGIVDPPPVHKVETTDGVSEDTYPANSGSHVVDHDVDMFHLFEVQHDVDAKVPE
jgi:hypothetical protein